MFRAIFRNSNGSDTSVTVTVHVYGLSANNISYSLCQGSSYTLGSHTYTIAGTYYDTIVGGGSHGCDSVMILHLSGSALRDTARASHATLSVSTTGATYQWLDCGTGQAISGATSQTYTASHNGSYRCVVKIGSCTDTTNCASVTGVGIIDVGESRVRLYPNPTSGSFTIKGDFSGTVLIHVVNILGERLRSFTLTTSQQTFDISDLAAGIYEVRVSDGSQTLQVLKVVKE
jgi:hypothetical protein